MVAFRRRHRQRWTALSQAGTIQMNGERARLACGVSRPRGTLWPFGWAHDWVRLKLRYFVGMTLDQAAEALGISERTAKRYWAFARAWLHEEIKAQVKEPSW
jgi:hypothetical protein